MKIDLKDCDQVNDFNAAQKDSQTNKSNKFQLLTEQ